MLPSFIKKYSFSKGFTLLELLISLAIIGLITGVVVFNQSNFSDRVSLSNTVNEIDLLIREAQVYSTSVREAVPSAGDFNVAYGVHFNLGNPGSSNSSLITFLDQAGTKNGIYDTPTQTCTQLTSPSPECIARYNLSRRNTITDLCVIKSNGIPTCYLAAPIGPIGRIDITFNRPNPNALIVFYNNSQTQVNSSYPGFLGARIEVTSPQGNKQYINVYTTGQISVQ